MKNLIILLLIALPCFLAGSKSKYQGDESNPCDPEVFERKEAIDELLFINTLWRIMETSHHDSGSYVKKHGEMYTIRFPVVIDSVTRDIYFYISWRMEDSLTYVYITEKGYRESYPYFFTAFFFNHINGYGTISRKVSLKQGDTYVDAGGTKEDNMKIMMGRIRLMMSYVFPKQKSPD